MNETTVPWIVRDSFLKKLQFSILYKIFQLKILGLNATMRFVFF